MTAPEREALVKELYQASDAIHLVIGPDQGSEDISALFRQAAATIKVLSAPAVTVTEEMPSGPICPFCGRDPFHYVHNGIGLEAVAVDCCELGDMYFRGARPEPEEVTLSWDDFMAIAARLTSPRERDAVLEEAAQIAECACLVPPDGGSPTEAETAVADEAAKRIRALKSTTPQTGSV